MTVAVIVLSIVNIALVVLVLKRILFTGTDGVDCELQVDETPFARLRGRSILLRGVLAVIPTFVLIAVLWPEWLKSDRLPVPDTLLGVLHYGIFYLLVARMLSTSQLSYSSLFGRRPGWTTLGRYALWTVPLIITAIGTTYLLYLPLSFLAPRFVEWQIIETEVPMIWTSGPGYTLANPMSFFLVVVIAPLFEELVRALLTHPMVVQVGSAKGDFCIIASFWSRAHKHHRRIFLWLCDVRSLHQNRLTLCSDYHSRCKQPYRVGCRGCRTTAE